MVRERTIAFTTMADIRRKILIFTHLAGSFKGLNIGLIEVQNAVPAFIFVGCSRGLYLGIIEVENVAPVYALKLYSVKVQQIRKRDIHHSKDLSNAKPNCIFILETSEPRLLGVIEVSL